MNELTNEKIEETLKSGNGRYLFANYKEKEYYENSILALKELLAFRKRSEVSEELEKRIVVESYKYSEKVHEVGTVRTFSTFQDGALFVVPIIRAESAAEIERLREAYLDLVDSSGKEFLEKQIEIENLKKDYFESPCAYCNQSKQIANQAARIKELEDFVYQINKYVMPGESDTRDAALIVFSKQKAEIEYLKSRSVSVHTCHDQCQKPLCVKRREKDAEIDKLTKEIHELRGEAVNESVLLDSRAEQIASQVAEINQLKHTLKYLVTRDEGAIIANLQEQVKIAEEFFNKIKDALDHPTVAFTLADRAVRAHKSKLQALREKDNEVKHD